tara:strand:+ start:836 stop:1108 length:273 start_codon:yes stop_codon:yes gene_type:complete
MAKAKKVKKDELELINKQQKQMNELLRGLGVLDVQKMNMHTQINGLSAAIETTKKDLEEKYGAVNIDLNTGVLTEIEECENCDNDKKDAK